MNLFDYRAPVYKVNNGAPRAKGFRRISTGVRRAPNTPKLPKKAIAQAPKMPHPLSGPAIPIPHMVPMNFPTVTFPPMMSFPTLPTFATIAMPTLPTMTMPPSFQRLMGITTTPSPSPKKSKSRRREEELTSRDEEVQEKPRVRQYESEERAPTPLDELSPVSSRLPKFVNSRKEPVVAPEKNADWIVPFKL
ncbi:unnamed protein product [Cylicostephanus goldi]|uniref:Uncharacterized protein n=1 Tax=Cylicostephanus goldi TaxID=71465 RepID=A0A3P7MT29_CYLGO|nr:unnamed protein product [Cylicostephanus goldi]